jgi:hypothetical protein
VDKMNRGVQNLKKKKKIFFSQMGNTHSGKPRKSLEKPGFPGIPGKFSSLKGKRKIFCILHFEILIKSSTVHDLYLLLPHP